MARADRSRWTRALLRRLVPCAVLLFAAGVAAAPAPSAPFIGRSRFLRQDQEAAKLAPDDRVRLSAIRSTVAVTRATVVACDPAAFASPAVRLDVPGWRAAVVISRTREETVDSFVPDGDRQRRVPMRNWVGVTDAGSTALFSIGAGGMSGLFDAFGRRFEVLGFGATTCAVVEYDTLKFPRDE